MKTYNNDLIIKNCDTELLFKSLVLDIVYDKMNQYTLKYVNEVNNTHLSPNNRTHFCSNNITVIYNRIASVSLVPQYKISDFDAYVMGNDTVLQNRINFCNTLLETDDILNFLFLNFNFQF